MTANESNTISVETLAQKVEALERELDKALEDFAQASIKAAGFTKQYILAKGKAISQVQGKNAEERKINLDVMVASELEDDTVWQSIVKYADLKVRGIQSKLAANRAIIQSLGRTTTSTVNDKSEDMVQLDDGIWAIPDKVETESEVPF